jgi:hypothetical protein
MVSSVAPAWRRNDLRLSVLPSTRREPVGEAPRRTFCESAIMVIFFVPVDHRGSMRPAGAGDGSRRPWHGRPGLASTIAEPGSISPGSRRGARVRSGNHLPGAVPDRPVSFLARRSGAGTMDARVVDTGIGVRAKGWRDQRGIRRPAGVLQGAIHHCGTSRAESTILVERPLKVRSLRV